MKLRKHKPHGKTVAPSTIAAIEWIDAAGQPGPVTRSELTGLIIIRSVGWLISEDDQHVSICQDYCPADDDFREVIHILKSNVLSRKEFKVRAKK